MKSYGRAPTFLALTGYEQVRSVAAELAGDHDAAARVELELPETGVCGGNGLFDDGEREWGLLRPGWRTPRVAVLAGTIGLRPGGDTATTPPTDVLNGRDRPGRRRPRLAETPRPGRPGRHPDRQLGDPLLRVPRARTQHQPRHRLVKASGHRRLLPRPRHLRRGRTRSRTPARPPGPVRRHDCRIAARPRRPSRYRHRPRPRRVHPRLDRRRRSDGRHPVPARLRRLDSLVAPRPRPSPHHAHPRRRVREHRLRTDHRSARRDSGLAQHLPDSRRPACRGHRAGARPRPSRIMARRRSTRSRRR